MAERDYSKTQISRSINDAFKRGYAPAKMARDFNVSMQTLALWADGRGEPAAPLKGIILFETLDHLLSNLDKGPTI